MAATLSIEILGDARRARGAIDDTSSSLRGLDRSAESASSGFASHMASIGKAAVAVGGIVAAGLTALAVSSWSAAEESAKIGRETERVIRTTGGAANVTADQVSDLAGSLGELTGVDDELIQSAGNLLLTFTNVRNEVGDGNDIFDQATALSLDMATALGTDASGAAIQLGKALNDPIKGISALSRAGVSFSEEQKKQIKTLVESGDILGAQKIILGELSKEFGGAAAAAATPLDRLKVKVGNLQEAFGARLIPIVDAAATWLGDNLPKAVDFLTPYLDAFGRFLTDTVVPAFSTVVDWAGDGLGAAFDAIGRWIQNTGLPAFNALSGFITETVIPALSSLAGWIKDKVVWAFTLVNDWINNTGIPAFKVLSGFITETVVPALAKIGDYIRDTLLPKLDEFVAWIENNRDKIGLLGAAIGAALAPFAPFAGIALIVAGLADAISQAWQNSQTFRDKVVELKDKLVEIWNTVIVPFGLFLRDVFVAAWERLVGVLTWLKDNVLPKVIEVYKFLWENVLSPLFSFVRDNSEVFETLGKIFAVIAGIIVVLLVVAIGILVIAIGIVVLAWLGVVTAVGFVIGIFLAVMAACWKVIQVLWDLFNNAKDAVGGMASFVGEKLGAIIDFFGTLKDKIGSAASGMWDGIKDAFRNAINWIVDKWNSLSFSLPSIDAFGQHIGGFTLDTPDLPRLATGGIVTRPTIALLGESGGEAVVPLRNLSAGNTYNITVTSTGLGPDSPQIARDVVAAIRRYERLNGSVAS